MEGKVSIHDDLLLVRVFEGFGPTNGVVSFSSDLGTSPKSGDISSHNCR